MLFAVQGMLPAVTVPPSRHVSIQRSVDLGRVDLDADVPPDVEQRYGRIRPVPEMPVGLDPPTRRKAVLDHLLDQIDAGSHYIRVPADDLPPYVWDWLSQAQAVAFVYIDPLTRRELAYVVVAVWADQSWASTRRNAEGGSTARPIATNGGCSARTGDRAEQPEPHARTTKAGVRPDEPPGGH